MNPLEGQDNIVDFVLGHNRSTIILGPPVMMIIPYKIVSDLRELGQCCDLIAIRATQRGFTGRHRQIMPRYRPFRQVCIERMSGVSELLWRFLIPTARVGVHAARRCEYQLKE